MALSADFSTRLTAAVAHAPASGGLTTVKADITTLGTDILTLVNPTNNAVQVGFEDKLIELASAVADELRTTD